MVIKAVTAHAKRIIAVSKNTKNDLVRLLKIRSEKISVVYEGVDKSFKPSTEDEKKEICKKYGILKPFMLYTGVWRSHKNLINLIKAFGYMKKKEGFDGQLVITGKDDPTYIEIKTNIKDLGLEADTIFTGMVDEADLPVLYGAARVYVFPSLYEGFGLPPLEAMACGTPVAVSKAACLPEVCGEKNAAFFDPYDPTDMGEVILRVWSNEELRQNLTDNGFKRSAEFSWEKMAREIVEMYETVDCRKN